MLVGGFCVSPLREWINGGMIKSHTRERKVMKDAELTNEPASNRHDTTTETDWETITQNNILDPHTAERFENDDSVADIFLSHMGIAANELTAEQSQYAIERFAEIAMEADYGYEIDAIHDRVYIVADTQDEYDQAVSAAALQLVDSEVGHRNAAQAYNESLDY